MRTHVGEQTSSSYAAFGRSAQTGARRRSPRGRRVGSMYALCYGVTAWRAGFGTLGTLCAILGTILRCEETTAYRRRVAPSSGALYGGRIPESGPLGTSRAFLAERGCRLGASRCRVLEVGGERGKRFDLSSSSMVSTWHGWLP